MAEKTKNPEAEVENTEAQEAMSPVAEAAKESAAAPAKPKAEESIPKAEKAADDEKADTAEKQTYKADKLPPKPPKSKEQLEWEAARKKNFNDKVWQPVLRPVVVLVAICLVTSLLLGLTNSLTAPIIEQNVSLAADNARKALLPEADSFTSLEVPGTAANVTAIYAADNGAGWVVEAFGKGYGGTVPAMVAFSPDGNIAGVTFLENNETPGLGQNLRKESFTSQFAGRAAEQIGMTDIDKIASATISTGAGLTAVNAAIAVFSEVVYGASSPQTPEEIRESLLPGAALEEVQVDLEGVQPTAWVDSATGNAIIYGEAQGVHSLVVAATAMDADGTILGLWLDTSGETEGIGTPVQNDKAFIEQFVGRTGADGITAVAGATLTCDAAAEAVENALAAYSEVIEQEVG